MPKQLPWLCPLLVCFGCHSVVPVEGSLGQPAPVQPTMAISLPTTPSSSARKLWEEGQQAMDRGETDRAIALYEQSLLANPQLTKNHLSLAAAYLEKGDEAGACPHLGRYVQAHVENGVSRVQYAELLWRLQRCPEARVAFQSVVADCQGDLPINHLIHCHSRLTQIAENESEEYEEHLNRGIGLFLLARELDELREPAGEMSVEGLLCRAAGELTMAHVERADEARPCWYLYRVWSRLAQRRPALRCLHVAIDGAPFSYLTPAEHRGLEMASRDADQRLPRR